jgi:hypothetical protein
MLTFYRVMFISSIKEFPSHFTVLAFIFLMMEGSPKSCYSSLLYPILHLPLSQVGEREYRGSNW